MNKEIISFEDEDLYFPGSFVKPDKLYDMLIGKLLLYHPSSNIKNVEKAYTIAFDAHKEQKRKSGEPYIIHPLCVAMTLTELRLDKETIIAGILHDIVEDTIMTNEEIEEEFGKSVAVIVEGVTKLNQLPIEMDRIDIQAENLRKFFLAMAKDIRVILVKLADRLHNIRTLQFQSPVKQQKIAKETIEIYAPLALRLGISKMHTELEDMAFMYMQRDIYHEILHKLSLTESKRVSFVKEIEYELSRLNTKAEIKAHRKHLYSIYKKTMIRNKQIEELYDIFTIYIIVNDVRDCYTVLGEIHNLFAPIHNRLKDYIALPKQNMYQSLHTTVLSKEGIPFEIQIKTKEMYLVSQYGIVCYWKYKENKNYRNNTKNDILKAAWLQSILEWQRDEGNNKNYLSLIKRELNYFSDTIYCFTPKGDIKILPSGSSVIDFAYKIHSEIANKMEYAMVNEKKESCDYILKNGDQIRIITSENANGPELCWLNIAKTAAAKTGLNKYFNERYKNNDTIGNQKFCDYCKSKMFELDHISEKTLSAVCTHLDYNSWKYLMTAVSLDIVTCDTLYEMILKFAAKEDYKKDKDRIVISKCCNPLPGDEIVGYYSKNRGVVIHKKSCDQIKDLFSGHDPKIIEIGWDEIKKERFLSNICIKMTNHLGLSKEIFNILEMLNIDLNSLNISMN